MKIHLRQWSSERISQTVLYALTGISVLAFALFYLVGYDRPYDENPDVNAPLLTGVLVTFLLVLVFLALAVTTVALVRDIKRHAREDKTVNGIPATRIAYGVAAGTILLLVLTFVTGSSRPIAVNGVAYSEALWLRVADMFVGTSLLLIAAAIVAVIFGATRYARRGKSRGRHAPNNTHLSC